MQTSVKIPLAVGAGYLLGRRHKMRWALAIAVGTATGGLGGLTSRAVKSGTKRLAATDSVAKFAPDLGQLADAFKGDLAGAGKAAARAAVNNRIDSVTGSLHDRTQALLLQADGADTADDDAEDRGSDDDPGRAGRHATGCPGTS